MSAPTTEPPSWPPTLEDLKTDRKIALDDTRDDDQLGQVLNAAIDFVQRVHASRYNFTGDLDSTLRLPTYDLVLGTIRMAGRWHERRRSPDGLIQMAELGASRVSGGDPDIDRLLRLGRHAIPVVG